ncbi:MAG TPA: serine hydrolase domain-containing protein [Acidimicrobiia bacterium]|jgi:CubicO group peptidase (beta-lactamase class C family)|nr:serine hydrolase domain-containing protein [Acidimicrobiia bacterium]
MSSIDELCGTARALVDSGATPACQLAVARDNEILCFETFSTGEQGAASNDTRFCVFSATKPIVASAIWLLIGEGVLDVSRPVAHYIPEFATNGKEHITVEQVLLHTAGFPKAPMDRVEGADSVPRVKRFTEWTLEWEPGTRFEYHGLSAHWVLAELIERLSGDDFRDYIEARVSEPLGLPRLLGIPEEEQDGIADGVLYGEPNLDDIMDPLEMNTSAVRAAGVPGGGGIMTAETMARFYQAVLNNRSGLWDTDVLRDAKTNIRCTFEDPLMHVGANRTIGLVLAGDDGLHQFRYAMFGKDNSPGSFGHGGAFCQVAWADPATGVSFAFLKNGWQTDMFADAINVLPLSDLASSLS